MKTLLYLLLFCLLAPLSLLAASGLPTDPPGPEVKPTVTIWQLAIPVITPLLLGLLRMLVERLPKRVVPFIAVAVGAALDIALNLLNLGDGNGALGAALGGLGIGVREIFDNGVAQSLKGKAIKGGTITLLCLLSFGCATQSASKVDKDGNRTEYKTKALFNKTAFSGISVDNQTKTTSNLLKVGTYGAEAQADALTAFLGGLQGLFEAGFKAGAAKALVPVP